MKPQIFQIDWEISWVVGLLWARAQKGPRSQTLPLRKPEILN